MMKRLLVHIILMYNWCITLSTVSCLLLGNAAAFTPSRDPTKLNHLNDHPYHSSKYPTATGHGRHHRLTITNLSFISNDEMKHSSRAQFLSKATSTIFISSFCPLPSFASSEDNNSNSNNNSNDSSQDKCTFTKIQENKNDPRQSFAYTLTLPAPYVTTRKPLPTHLDEVNLVTTSSPNVDDNNNNNSLKGYSFGITVDPIRIASLREFGTPNEVAAKIVMAELRRDGVLDVTMGRDPLEDPATGAYDVEYLSDGTRGKKHFVTRTIVKGQKLYVLTVQCKEGDWKSVEREVWDSVATFRALDI
mmetsp:Transcript_7482/g.14183  ORF Transcript_7482/g.14183 Transcript_7482/m.14183 type:complete len:304 (+) Transcript_7482:110-1021(+)